MVDGAGNVTRSEIQQVYVGAGTYRTGGNSGYTEDVNGGVPGVYPFLVTDSKPPSVPAKPTPTAVTGYSVQLSWPASTDNIGVAGYQVYRDGALRGTTPTTGYTDNGLTPKTSYSYQVAAYDAAGNVSAKSPARIVTTRGASGNSATVYYKVPGGWTTVNIHYAPDGGAWTPVPGVPMNPACSGWDVYTVNLGQASGWQTVFNNGQGVWDNNGGRNYSLGTGLWQVANGVVTGGVNPCATQARR